ncbi:fructose 1,6-bisphosphatase, partial [Listeria innocua]|nr:fructose 1,6-bisphosphatase [Listeria innocua]
QFESEMNRKYEALVREVLVSLKANTDSNQQVRIVLDTLMNFEEEIENA